MNRYKLLTALSFIVVCHLSLVAQDPREEYEKFKQQALKQYTDFRNQANTEYADWLRKSWVWAETLPSIEYQRDKKVPPVVADDNLATKDNQIEYDHVVYTKTPDPQPSPLSPVVEQHNRGERVMTIDLYGTPMRVRVNDQMRFVLPQLTPNHIADQWLWMGRGANETTLFDLLALRRDLNLDDWSYLLLIDNLTAQMFGQGISEAEMLKAYLMTQSGYAMRLAIVDNNLRALFGSKHLIFGKLRLVIGGVNYYLNDTGVKSIRMCDASFKGETPLSLYINKLPLIAEDLSEKRSLSSKAAGISVELSQNQNLIKWCEAYPTSQIGDNPISRWGMYASTPLSDHSRNMLYPQLRSQIEGKSVYDAVNALCRWVQTAFDYEYDDIVWGDDRAFFAEETLYYPYCDCEDRSILLTRIAKDLLNLDCALVYYPGHITAAIAIGDDAKGDYILLDGKKFLICDPTYINADIGHTMPGMDNSIATVLKLG